tara:strand:- start:616 stop:795 length:180 start_codon:yes stop_codon:yes gene_type:complete
MTEQPLELLIKDEIRVRLADPTEDNINLVKDILKPMLLFIENHNQMVRDIARISGKHIT